MAIQTKINLIILHYTHWHQNIRAIKSLLDCHALLFAGLAMTFQDKLKTYTLRYLHFLLTAFFLTTPLYGQNFDMLLDELAGSETEQLESEMAPSSKEEPYPSMPSSTELQASPEEDDFAPKKNIVTNGVTLQGLDKQTARVFIIDALVGQPIEFGTLKIVVQHCERAPLENRQESMAFIRIAEQKPNSSVQNLFSGWMFSSSPALSALDHPIYDVWVKECKTLDVKGGSQ